MATFNDNESGSSVRTKINAAITTVDSLNTGDNLLLTAAERSAIAANTAKTTNATHTGDVTGSTALTIADDAVTLAKIAAAAKSGSDATLITGTAGTSGNAAIWNGDGDLVDGPAIVSEGTLSAKATPVAADRIIGLNSEASQAYCSFTYAQLATNTTNVTAAGALMDSEVTNLADVKAFDPADYAPATLSLNAQTGTTYTLVLGDAGKKVTMSNASANTLTIPTNASVAFPAGTIIGVSMIGAGTTSVAGDTGVTLNGVSAGSGDISAQYTGVTLTKLATDTWLMEGNHGAVA